MSDPAFALIYLEPLTAELEQLALSWCVFGATQFVVLVDDHVMYRWPMGSADEKIEHHTLLKIDIPFQIGIGVAGQFDSIAPVRAKLAIEAMLLSRLICLLYDLRKKHEGSVIQDDMVNVKYQVLGMTPSLATSLFNS